MNWWLVPALPLPVSACSDEMPFEPDHDFEIALEELRHATARYHDLDAAIADGFVMVTDLLVNGNVGMLFIAMHGKPRRLRVYGVATVSRDDPLRSVRGTIREL
ncbi:MAG: hypothetical protein ACREM1_01245 [Longimicrobiales bacterium]